MKLENLIQAHVCGALNVKDVAFDRSSGVVGGMQMSRAQCNEFVTALGWKTFDKDAFEIVDKTNKFIRSIAKYLTNDTVIYGTEVGFENHRRMNTEKYFDRIKMVNPRFDITILYGMHGVGGAYAVYSAENNFIKPVFNCKTAKQLCEYLNEMI